MPTDAAAGLREAMAEHGIVTDAPIVADGALHRIQVEGDKRDSRNGWYVLHADEPAAGAFGSWRTGVSATWCAGSNGRLSDVERREWQRKAKATRDRQQKEARRRRQRASDRAAKLWERSKPADPEHPYLRRKGVGAHGIRQRGDVLLIPVRGADGGLRGLQRIYPSGSKMFAAGTEATGGYFGIGSPAGTVVIAEGFATAATIHEATGHAVAVAYSAGNLEPVAKALRGKLGADVRIIIAADNDNPTPNDPNPGLTAATKAARAVGALLAVPDDRPADFNDVAGERGPDAVRATIDSARAPVDEPAVQRETRGAQSSAGGTATARRREQRFTRGPRLDDGRATGRSVDGRAAGGGRGEDCLERPGYRARRPGETRQEHRHGRRGRRGVRRPAVAR